MDLDEDERQFRLRAKRMEAARNAPDPRAASIRATAARLGIDPLDLATIVSYETAGTFSPSIKGGKGGQYEGVIQFGPEERRRYGVHGGQSFEEQLGAAESFLKDRGFKLGMGIRDLYSTILAGSPGLYDRSDGRGTVDQHLASQDMAAHRAKASRLLGTPASAPQEPVQAPRRTAGPDVPFTTPDTPLSPLAAPSDTNPVTSLLAALKALPPQGQPDIAKEHQRIAEEEHRKRLAWALRNGWMG